MSARLRLLSMIDFFFVVDLFCDLLGNQTCKSSMPTSCFMSWASPRSPEEPDIASKMCLVPQKNHSMGVELHFALQKAILKMIICKYIYIYSFISISLPWRVYLLSLNRSHVPKYVPNIGSRKKIIYQPAPSKCLNGSVVSMHHTFRA